MACPCGTSESHRVAHRRTADGVVVVLWDDGAVTGLMGLRLVGVPVVRPRTEAALSVARSAGWMFLGEVEIYDADEIGSLYAACRWAAEHGLSIGDARARLAGAHSVRPSWTILSADRDGNPKERVWQLPRLRWPGLAVWDTCNAALRYEVMDRDRHGTCTTTGFKFATLAELAAHLEGVAPEWGCR